MESAACKVSPNYVYSLMYRHVMSLYDFWFQVLAMTVFSLLVAYGNKMKMKLCIYVVRNEPAFVHFAIHFILKV